jgi:hypothetical protein
MNNDNPALRKYKCECGYISPDEVHALSHQGVCDSPMEQINTTKPSKKVDEEFPTE